MSSYRRFEVKKKVIESRSVVSLYLTAVDEPELPLFKPGQHLLFKLHVPGQEVPSFRYYSFSDTYNSQYYRVSVKKECSPCPANNHAGLCSSYIFDMVSVGDILEAKGPSGEFCISAHSTEPIVLIAGGIGITPLLSMLKSIGNINAMRDVYFYYGVNEQCDHSFRDELNELKKKYANFHLVTFYNKVQPGDIHGEHYDHEGFLTAESIFQPLPDIQLNYYICGPGGMMSYITDALENAGVKKELIHTESFNIDVNTNQHELEPAASETLSDTTVPLIEFKRSRKKLLWDKRYRSILEFAEANDIEISSGCLFGDCGTCLTKIASGDIKYIHPTMVQPGEGKCLPCSCIPSTHLVLEA